ncbi:LPD29 domain-containing protein [Burkholderia ubonensis]|uniref:LPD29 domain-containing protein n=1 Tax=Burkholderia ubonensis TaxID=101571 RepID=UPI00075BBDC1|nr:LPD29 domain-containing protein [Burkholderia ubonensis]KVQ24259.1 hypothetical protein WK00_23585 [Burkholderia ubonensis]
MRHAIVDHCSRHADPVRTRAFPDVATPPTVLADVLTLVDTAQLVQTILREAFPATLFAISVARNEHGSQLAIGWTDGPQDLQVARLVMPLQATRLADDGKVERVEHFILTPAGRQSIQLAAERITLSRQFSDRAIEQALARLASRYAGYLTLEIHATMTVDGYRAGQLQTLEILGVHQTGTRRSGSNVQTDLDEILAETTDAHGFPRSITAERLFVRIDVH